METQPYNSQRTRSNDVSRLLVDLKGCPLALCLALAAIGPLSMDRLARVTSYSKPSVRAGLQRLQDRGYVLETGASWTLAGNMRQLTFALPESDREKNFLPVVVGIDSENQLISDLTTDEKKIFSPQNEQLTKALGWAGIYNPTRLELAAQPGLTVDMVVGHALALRSQRKGIGVLVKLLRGLTPDDECPPIPHDFCMECFGQHHEHRAGCSMLSEHSDVEDIQSSDDDPPDADDQVDDGVPASDQLWETVCRELSDVTSPAYYCKYIERLAGRLDLDSGVYNVFAPSEDVAVWVTDRAQKKIEQKLRGILDDADLRVEIRIYAPADSSSREKSGP